jgi:hypothetical protein
MDGEPGQVLGPMTKRFPTAANLTDVYQWFHRRTERLVGEMVRLVLWPIPGKVTDLYQGLERRSKRLVREWLTPARNSRKAARRSDEDNRHSRK